MKRYQLAKIWEVSTQQIAWTLASVPSNPVGTPINWIRGELIGKGTYARVYLALNVHNGEMMAMKQVEMPQTVADKEDARQTHVIAAIKHENSIHAKLSHPNVVQYLGFEETPSFYSM